MTQRAWSSFSLVGLIGLGAACGDGPVTIQCEPGSCSGDRVCHEGQCVDVCVDDAGCRAGHVCDGGLCLIGERQVQSVCEAPAVSIESSSGATDLYVGFSVDLTGTVSAPSPACPVLAGWAVCQAPEGSSFALGLASGCVAIGGTTTDVGSLLFAPDRRGDYLLRFEGATVSASAAEYVAVTAHAEAFFAELSYADHSWLRGVMTALANDNSCWGHDQASCAGPGCTWLADRQMCWSNCAARTDETACFEAGYSLAVGAPSQGVPTGLGTFCAWDAPTSTCVTDPSAGFAPACYRRNEDDCEDLAGCVWHSGASACTVDCALQLDVDSCVSAGCQPTAFLGCRNLAVEVPMPVPVQVYSDGSGLAFVQTGPLGYRYDPNDKFSFDAPPGSGARASSLGLATLPGADVALVPYQYLVEYTDPAGTYCMNASTLVLWQQGRGLGVPEVVEDLGLLFNDAPYNVGPPEIILGSVPNLVRATAPGEVAIALQEAVDGSVASAAGVACGLGGAVDYDLAYAAGVVSAGSFTLLDVTPDPSPIKVARLNNQTFVATRLWVDAGDFPCAVDQDCGAGTCDTGAGRCLEAFEVRGFQPRLFAGGEGITFGHLSCATGHGEVCAADEQAFHALVIGRVTFDDDLYRLRDPQWLLSGIGSRFVDVLWRGDAMGASQLIALRIHFEELPVQVNSASGFAMTPHPLAELERYTVNRSGSGPWQVTMPPTILEASAPVTDRPPPTPTVSCPESKPLEIDPNEMFSSAMQPILSGDGRYLAYARSYRDYDCDARFNGPAPALGSPHAADVFVIDLDAPGGGPALATPSSCGTRLNAINEMPTFIAGGSQLIFSSRALTGGDRLLRANVVDILAAPADCHATEVLAQQAAEDALAVVAPGRRSLGLRINDTRVTFERPIPLCSAASWPRLWPIFLVALLFHVRLRRPLGARHGLPAAGSRVGSRMSRTMGLVGLGLGLAWVTLGTSACVVQGGVSGGGCVRDVDCGDGHLCVYGACFAGCNTDSDCGGGDACQRGICVGSAAVTISSATPSVISHSGLSRSSLTWQSTTAGTFSVRVGSDCQSGIGTSGDNVIGSATANAANVSTIDAAALAHGANTVWVCLTTDTGEFSAATEIIRDELPPLLVAEPGAGIFVDDLEIILACTEPGLLVYTLDGTEPEVTSDGTITHGSEYTAPFPLGVSATLRGRCVDAAGNVGPVDAVEFSLMPEVRIVSVSRETIGSTAFYDRSLVTFTSSLPGTFTVMMRGSCNRGKPYPALPAPVAADTEVTVTIRADDLTDGEGAYPVRICVEESGGLLGSAAHTIVLDESAPDATALPTGDICVPYFAYMSCGTSCTSIIWRMEAAPAFDSLGNLTAGNVYDGSEPIDLDAAISGSTGTMYFRALDAAGNLGPLHSETYTIVGDQPVVTLDLAPTVISASTAQNTAVLDITSVPSGLAFHLVQDGDCSGTPIVSGTTGTPLDLDAAAFASDPTVCITAAIPACDASYFVPLVVKNTSEGFGPTWSLDPARVDLSFADDTVSGSATGTATWSVSPDGATFVEMTATPTFSIEPTGVRFTFDRDLLPELILQRLNVTLTGDLVDEALNPLPLTFAVDERLPASDRIVPVPTGWEGGAQTVQAIGTDLLWTTCTLDNNTDCIGAPSPYNFVDAVNACAKLGDSDYAGRGDWRLPRWRELLSLLDESGGTPYIDAAFSLSGGSDIYWAATGTPVFESSARVIDFQTGENRYANRADLHFVRCVAGGATTPREAYQPGVWLADGTFFRSPEGLVAYDTHLGIGFETDPVAIDSVTGVIQVDGEGRPLPASPTSWPEAEARCAALAALGYAGVDDWRLPTLRELMTTVPPSLADAHWTFLMPLLSEPWQYWTTLASGGSERWIVEVGGDVTVSLDEATPALTRCITNGP